MICLQFALEGSAEDVELLFLVCPAGSAMVGLPVGGGGGLQNTEEETTFHLEKPGQSKRNVQT